MTLWARTALLALGLAAFACGSEEGRKNTAGVEDDGRDGGAVGGSGGTAGTSPQGGTAGTAGSLSTGGLAGTPGTGGLAGEGGTPGVGGTAGVGGSAGTAGMAGSAGAPPLEGTSSQALLSSGGVSKNADYTLVMSAGEAPGGNRVMSSSDYRLQLGVTGATQP